MYIATFENRYKQVKELGRAETKEKAMEYIDDFLFSYHYKPTYIIYYAFCCNTLPANVP